MYKQSRCDTKPIRCKKGADWLPPECLFVSEGVEMRPVIRVKHSWSFIVIVLEPCFDGLGFSCILVVSFFIFHRTAKYNRIGSGSIKFCRGGPKCFSSEGMGHSQDTVGMVLAVLWKRP